MIRVEGLTKSYGNIRALNGVSFNVNAGEIVGLLGPNGAGKTTTIKLLTGYLQPDAGLIEIDGLDILTQRLAVQARLGYLPENTPLYPELSVQTYLHLIADLRQIPAAQQIEAISDAAYATDLVEYLNRPIGNLSKGTRQRVGLAQAILHKPKLLILDEPTVGLDPTQIIEIRRLIRRLAQSSTVLFSTHILPEVEALCDRAIIIMHGEVRADARLADLATTDNAILVLQQALSRAEIETALKDVPGVKQVEVLSANAATKDAAKDASVVDGNFPTYRVYGQHGTDLCPALYATAAKRGWPVRELRRDARTLETVFNDLARGN